MLVWIFNSRLIKASLDLSGTVGFLDSVKVSKENFRGWTDTYSLVLPIVIACQSVSKGQGPP